MRGIDSRAEGLGARPQIKDPSPLTQRDPPLSFGKRSPQYVRSRCICEVYLHGACRDADMRGESGIVDFAEELRLISGASPPFATTYRCIMQLILLAEHVRDGRGSLGECRGIDFRGRGFGCQTLRVAEGLGARPQIKDASPLTQRDPPLSFGKRSPQYVRSRCICEVYLHGACRDADMRGESGVVDFAEELRLPSCLRVGRR